LLDDNFATLVAAIEEGRSIYENVQKFIRTLFSTNLSETMLIAVGALIIFGTGSAAGDLRLPLAAVQILWINLLTDSLPALALATDRNPGAMAQPPRPASAPLLDRASLRFIVIVGVLGGLVGLGLLGGLPPIGHSLESTQTVVFSFLVFVQLSFVLPARRVHWQPMFNWLVVAAIAVSVAAQFLALFVPALSQALQSVPLSLPQLTWVAVATLFCWLVAEATVFRSRRSSVRAPTT
jgi:Ca2+-transporting ATPase